ncbi:MAG TPA: 23S rRNA (adenine(2503)-C(2))-methyltransferase RlmN [Thermoanaerobaculia bacterium]|nr:23S rRNA (adenine(2503)-C(2))-methyltransferase RlmN [Thermoanaerobaculia bacterium]
MTNETSINLYDLAPRELERTLGEIVSPPFRVRQIAEWLHVRGVDSFEAMSNIPKDVRARLAASFTLALPKVVERTEPAADGSQKYLFILDDGNRIESVYMPMRDRASICLSSQAGCAVGCTFCVTGFFGAGRNLTPSEMLGQFFIVQREHAIATEMMNVVFMGMGEPLLNFENLVTTLEALYRNIAPKRITVSTSGIIPGIEDLAKLDRRPNLAISINAPDRKRREEIMPITKKYPLHELMAALRRFPLEKGREMTIEYVLLAGYNDSPDDARALAKLIRALHAKVNAIPFNADPNLPAWMKRPTDAAIDRFVDALVGAGARVTVRRSKGREIAAACGQLRGKTEARSRASRERELANRRVDRAGRTEAARVERHRVDDERR